jgi:glycine hydroxymethyltransferase
MPKIAEWIDQTVQAANNDDEATIERIAGEIRELLAGYPMPGWS